MNYNKSYLIMNVGIVIGIAISIIFALVEVMWIAYVGIIVVIASLIQASIFYKCPNCNESLNIRGKKPKYCPECGFKLEE